MSRSGARRTPARYAIFLTSRRGGVSGAEYQARLDTVIGAFTEYRLPVVTLRDLSVEEVCPIFERINSSGTKLSTYDLMVAQHGIVSSI